MSDEKDTFKEAVESVLGPRALRVVHKAIVVDQDSAGNIGVKLPNDGAPSATAKPVPILFGLPGFSATLNAGSEISVGFHNGAEDSAYAALFPFFPRSMPEVPLPLTFDVLRFGGGDRPIARVEDSVGCGSIILSNLPPAPGPIPTGIQIKYQQQDGTQLILGTILGLVTVVPDPLTISLNGLITSGRSEFRA